MLIFTIEPSNMGAMESTRSVDGGIASGGSRFFILAAAVAMQVCLGATYAWAVFVGPLRTLLDISQGTAQLPFTVFYFVFPATMVFAGRWLPRLGPARSAILGGLLFGGGWMLASFGGQSFVPVVLGIGVFAGIGVGFAYIVPIAVGVRWFPRHKGLVTGIAVAGFGGGAALVSQVAGRMLTEVPPSVVFRSLGAAFAVIVSVAGACMRFPTRGPQTIPPAWDWRELFHRTEFRRLYGAMVAGLAAGFAVNANLKELAPGKAAEVGVLAVSLFAVANALGRILWGIVFDRFGPAITLRLNLVLQALVLLAGLISLGGPVGFVCFAAAAGFNYGGVLVLYASTVAREYGADRVGEVYGSLFTANIVAAPAAVLCGYLYDVTGSFAPALAALAVAALLATRGLRTIPEKP